MGRGSLPARQHAPSAIMQRILIQDTLGSHSTPPHARDPERAFILCTWLGFFDIRACVAGGGGVHHFDQVSRWSLYAPHWRPRVGSLPIGEAHGAGQGCVPVLPLDQCNVHFRPDPGALPQDHPGSGVVAPWLPRGQPHSSSSTSPSSPCCSACCVCIGAFTAGDARSSEVASTVYSIGRFPQKGCP